MNNIIFFFILEAAMFFKSGDDHLYSAMEPVTKGIDHLMVSLLRENDVISCLFLVIFRIFPNTNCHFRLKS